MKNQVSLKDIICNNILEDIISLEFKPNEILTEGYLIEKYGCSKTPIREALHILCNDNVLRNIPRCGYEVVSLTTDDIRNMLQFRYILESGILALNYKNFTDAQIDKLEEIDAKCTQADKNLLEHWKYNSEFHLTMISFCKNSYAYNELERTLSRLKRGYAQLRWNDIENRCLALDTQSHASIIRALRDKSSEDLMLSLEKDLGDFEPIDLNFKDILNRSEN